MSDEEFNFSRGMEQFTEYLHRLNAGERRALDHVVKMAYAQVHLIAENRLKHEIPEHLDSLTEGASEITIAAFLKLMRQRKKWKNRDHYFAVAAILVRNIVRDYRRRRNAQKRGRANHVNDENLLASIPSQDDALDALARVYDLIEALRKQYPRQADVVALRFVFNYTMQEIATLLKVSLKTVEYDWSMARAWLRRYLEGLR